MRIPRWFKVTLAAIGTVALGIQFIPVVRTNPPVVKTLVWDSPKTEALARRACFDCHSNETRWPWYAYVAPASWLVTGDVKDAREEFNFSEVSSDDRAERLIERIESGEMPPLRYRALHGEARLSETEKQEYIAGLRRSFQRSGLAPDEAKHK